MNYAIMLLIKKFAVNFIPSISWLVQGRLFKPKFRENRLAFGVMGVQNGRVWVEPFCDAYDGYVHRGEDDH